MKTITKIGNSKGVILDAAILEMAHLKVGDSVNVTVHEGGSITFTPVENRSVDDETFDEVLDKTLHDYSETFTKLS
ncbi:hypothetical protein AAFN60_10160 [Roseibacillus persicicus]|uniref:AbrB/MazE/SpoVT family DNA-binding domain-containing protein n=1 Tax=Roseibacillus persicicus TaxID=454148 RepID=UPI00398B39AB